MNIDLRLSLLKTAYVRFDTLDLTLCNFYNIVNSQINISVSLLSYLSQ